MFKITQRHGFHITFENGWTVSVQFGPGNYCDNYYRRIGEEDEICGKEGSSTAECAVWSRDGGLYPHPDWGGDTVTNRSTPAEVLELLNWASEKETVAPDTQGV